MFGLPRPLPVTLEVRTEYLEATQALVKRLEISKELIHECKCAWLLLHATAAKSFDGLMQLCTQKYIASRQRGVHMYPPTPPGSATMFTQCV